jgi:hypothetical protein
MNRSRRAAVLPEKVSFVIVKAREFDVKDEAATG